MIKQIVCRMCRDCGPAAQAHVIPNAFFKRPLTECGKLITLSIGSPEHVQTRQSGEWDLNLWCRTCESRFQEFDRDAVRVLRDDLCEQWRLGLPGGPHWRLSLPGCPQLLMLHGIDCARLRKFAMLTVWRVLASNRPPFAGVQDVDAEEDLRVRLLADSVGDSAVYPVLLRRWDQRAGVRTPTGEEYSVDPRDMPMYPRMHSNLWGHRAVELPLGEYILLVAIDQEPPRSPWSTFALPDDGTIFVILEPFASSRNFAEACAAISAGKSVSRGHGGS